MRSRRKPIPNFLHLFFEYWGIEPVVRDHPHFRPENYVDEPAGCRQDPNPLQDLWRLHRLSTGSEERGQTQVVPIKTRNPAGANKTVYGRIAAPVR